MRKKEYLRNPDPIAHGYTEPLSCRRVSNHSKNRTTKTCTLHDALRHDATCFSNSSLLIVKMFIHYFRRNITFLMQM